MVKQPTFVLRVDHYLDMCGITQDECVEYLHANGIPASIGSIRAWNRGVYQTPRAAWDAIRALWDGVYGKVPMPPHAPESAIRRMEQLVADDVVAEQEQGGPTPGM